jgi:hypothetical protein
VKSSAPSAETHPHTFAWFALVNRFTEAVRASWAAPAAPAKGGKAPAPKKEEPKKEAAPADDDELDLFGDSGPTEVRKYILNRVLILINRRRRLFSRPRRRRLRRPRREQRRRKPSLPSR